jgi:ankyrin repeat protein
MTANIDDSSKEHSQSNSSKPEPAMGLEQDEKDKSLIQAVNRNDIEAVKSLVGEGANILARDTGDYNSLHYIAQNDNKDLFDFIIDEAASKELNIQKFINSRTLRGESALDIAAEYSSTSILNVLLEKGASIDVSRLGGATPLHFIAENCLVPSLVKVLEKTTINIDNQDVRGNTPLHFAVVKDCCEAVRLLINKGSNLNVVNNVGEYAIHITARKGHSEIVRELLYHSAISTIADKYGNLPIHLAARHGYTAVVSELAYVVDIDIINAQDKTPLFLAAENGQEETFKYLAKNGANIDYAQLQAGTRIIDAASIGGNTEILDYLFEAGVRVSNIRELLATPYHYAASCGNVDLIKYLNSKIIGIDLKDYKGFAPIQMAILNRDAPN